MESESYSFTQPTVKIGPVTPLINSKQIWEEITAEYSEKRLLYEQYKCDQLPPDPPIPNHDLPANYLDKEVFPILLPALRQTLEEAKRWDCLQVQKCRFNGLDYIAELLWNRNPRYPNRAEKYTDIFKIPFAKEYLEKHPRPIYPLSWLWTPEEAALRIQRFVRGFLVRKDPEVQEMRQFWKVYNAEKEEARQQKIKAMKEESMMQAKLRLEELTTKLEKTINQLEINKLISIVVNKAIGLSENEYWSGIVEAYELQMEEENEQAAGEYKFHRIESDEASQLLTNYLINNEF